MHFALKNWRFYGIYRTLSDQREAFGCAGCRGGAVGSQGDFWGNANPSLWFSSGTAYELRNVEARRIAIFDSRWQGVRIQAAGGRPVLNLDLEDISVNGVENYEYAFYIAPGVRGNGTYSNLTATGVVEPAMSPVPAGFTDANAARSRAYIPTASLQ